MSSLQPAGIMAFVLVLAAAVAASPCANQLTYFTFKAPFEIPEFQGPKVLPAGTYAFKLLDSKPDRDIVQIFKKSQMQTYAAYGTLIAVRDLRMKPNGRSVSQFSVTLGGSPRAIKAWFYPGDAYGGLFVYPKTTAVQLAKANKEPVLSMPDEIAVYMGKPIGYANDPAVKKMEDAPIKAETQNAQEVEASQVVTLPGAPLAH